MAKYYMEEVFSLKDGGYDFAPFEYEDDEEVKKVVHRNNRRMARCTYTHLQYLQR